MPISTQTADQRIHQLATAHPAPTVKLPLGQCAGRILRSAVCADRDLPPFDRVMMDGFAVRWPEATANPHFRIEGRSHAGEPASALSEKPDAAVEVMTGAPLPAGADTVIPIETVALEGRDTFRIRSDIAVEKGQFIHRKGEDFAGGTSLLAPGGVVNASAVGIAASCGYAELTVDQPPVIHVFGSGDELVPISKTPLPHQIRQSNAAACAAALELARFPATTIGHFSDQAEVEIERLRQSCAESEVVILSGAVSMGRKDWIPAALNTLGTQQFHRVTQRPAKVMGLWTTAAGAVVFALPGNPVSTLVGLHRFVLPFLRRRAGAAPEHCAPRHIALAEPVHFGPPMTWFLPVRLNSAGDAVPTPVNNSVDYARLAQSDGFVELAADTSDWKTGTPVPYFPWM